MKPRVNARLIGLRQAERANRRVEGTVGMTPFIDSDLDPRLREMLDSAPASAAVIFAGKDAVFLSVIRRTFRLALPTPDVLITRIAGGMLIIIALGQHGEPGLLLNVTPAEAGTITLNPTLITLDPTDKSRWRGAGWDAQAVTDALGDLVFRRLMPARRVS